MSQTWQADQTRATVLGPMPGRRRSSSIVGLYFCRSSSRRGRVPVERSDCMLAAMPLPMPEMARSCLGSSARVASWVVCCSTASAARR